MLPLHGFLCHFFIFYLTLNTCFAHIFLLNMSLPKKKTNIVKRSSKLTLKSPNIIRNNWVEVQQLLLKIQSELRKIPESEANSQKARDLHKQHKALLLHEEKLKKNLSFPK